MRAKYVTKPVSVVFCFGLVGSLLKCVFLCMTCLFVGRLLHLALKISYYLIISFNMIRYSVNTHIIKYIFKAIGFFAARYCSVETTKQSKHKQTHT